VVDSNPGPCGSGPQRPDNLNSDNGSFSTNYVDVGVTRVWLRFDDGLERRMHGPSLTVRGHIPGTMDSAQAQTYGRVDVMGAYIVRFRPFPDRWLRPLAQLTPEFECGLNRGDEFERCRYAVTGMLAFSELYGLGIAARYASGFDYYNVAYGQQLRGFTVGVSFDHTRALTITPEARSRIARRAQ
jgi:hypothetical protein